MVRQRLEDKSQHCVRTYNNWHKYTIILTTIFASYAFNNVHRILYL